MTVSRMFFILFGLQLLAGCVGLTASISSQNAPGRKIVRTESFYFQVPNGASAEDKRIVQAFIDEFRVQGLEVASEASKAEAAYVVAVAFADKSSTTAGSLPMSQTQFEPIRNVNGMPVGFVQTGSTTEVPYSADYRVRTVNVSISTLHGIVWNGHIVSEAKALSAHSRCIIRELVTRLGTDYHAPTRIDIACRNR